MYPTVSTQSDLGEIPAIGNSSRALENPDHDNSYVVRVSRL